MHSAGTTVSLTLTYCLNVFPIIETIGHVVSLVYMEMSAARCVCLSTFGCVPSQVSMDLLQDSSHTMLGLNARLKGFLEQVNRLQEANRRLEAQIAEWGIRSSSRSQDWSQQEQTVKDLRAQVRLIYLVVFIDKKGAADTLPYYFMLISCVTATKRAMSAGGEPK